MKKYIYYAPITDKIFLWTIPPTYIKKYAKYHFYIREL